jgi:hypothetical protein
LRTYYRFNAKDGKGAAMDLIQALDKIDELKKQKITGYLHNTLIEGIYDKKGVLVEGLWEWHVRTK